MVNGEETYKKMAKDFLDVIVQKNIFNALDNTEGMLLHRDFDAHFYGVNEGVGEIPGCQKPYTLLHYMGINSGRLGGTGEHKLDHLLEKTGTNPNETINQLFEKYGKDNVSVIYTERELDDRELKIMSELVPDFHYLGTMHFNKDGEIERFNPE